MLGILEDGALNASLLRALLCCANNEGMSSTIDNTTSTINKIFIICDKSDHYKLGTPSSNFYRSQVSWSDLCVWL